MSLGADPVKDILHTTGTWALRFLAATLLMTPLKELTGSLAWLRLRRMLGLYVFFYAVLHFSTYVFLDQDGKLSAIWQDIAKRPYITLGFLGLLLLVPLAITSTARAQRRLGRRWTRLHRLAYVVAGLGVWHYWWLVKKDIRPPLAYAAVFAVLIGYRVGHRLWRRHRADRGSAPHGLERAMQLQEQRLGAVPADARIGDRYAELERG
ncbi:MAG TPA: protein-methionine-sulfoxide reductase heme-binding subunit MsrQ [Steroidobacteraceae bacterium]